MDESTKASAAARPAGHGSRGSTTAGLSPSEWSATGAAVAVARRIVAIRGQQVMLDADLAELYGVETKRLIEQVKRNIERFPEDFMLQLSEEEASSLRSQTATSKGRGGRRTRPYVFTEQGVAMLSSVLRSKRAVAVNIQIMRAFVELRRMAASHAALETRLDELERELGAKLGEHDTQLAAIFETLRRLMAPPAKPKRRIGFAPPGE